jgi:hypothetical protein
MSAVGVTTLWWEKLLTFAPALAAGGAVYAGFAKLEDLAAPGAKASITAWLERLDTRSVAQQWPNHFGYLFDKVFGNKHLSISCFFRSCIASSVFSAFCLLILYLSGNFVPYLDLYENFGVFCFG